MIKSTTTWSYCGERIVLIMLEQVIQKFIFCTNLLLSKFSTKFTASCQIKQLIHFTIKTWPRILLASLNPFRTATFFQNYYRTLSELSAYERGLASSPPPICWINLRVVMVVLVMRVLQACTIAFVDLDSWTRLLMVDYIHLMSLPTMFRSFNVSYFVGAMAMFHSTFTVSSRHPISFISNQIYFHHQPCKS